MFPFKKIDLELFLDFTQIYFDIIAITEIFKIEVSGISFLPTTENKSDLSVVHILSVHPN